MTDTQKIEIPISKGKMTKMLFGSIAFVLIGFWLLIFQPSISNPVFDNVFVKYGAAIASILFFGFTLIYSIRKLSDTKPGIIIGENGIIDNSSAVAVGLIPWADIRQIKRVKMMNQEFVIIVVKNPGDYMDKSNNFLKKKGMEYNYKNYGSPLAISANGLKCDVNELVRMLEQRLAKTGVHAE